MSRALDGAVPWSQATVMVAFMLPPTSRTNKQGIAYSSSSSSSSSDEEEDSEDGEGGKAKGRNRRLQAFYSGRHNPLPIEAHKIKGCVFGGNLNPTLATLSGGKVS